MGFWLFCTGINLLVPGIMMFFGWRFRTKPPKHINGLYGYRTARSMKNQQTWDFAHAVCGTIWFRVGVCMLPLSVGLMLPSFGRDIETVGLWCGGITLLQVVVLLGTIVPVERALKQNFDQFGRKR